MCRILYQNGVGRTQLFIFSQSEPVLWRSSCAVLSTPADKSAIYPLCVLPVELQYC